MSGTAFRRGIAVLVVAVLSVAGAVATAEPPDSDLGYYNHIHVTYID